MAATESRVIKRYANRKLYDTQNSRYVTLDQIAEMIRGGEDVKIVDNNSKEDLTAFTLAQIIFEEEKKQKQFLPLAAMRNIIQTGGQSITNFVAEAGDKMRSVFRRGKGGEGEGEEGAAEGSGEVPASAEGEGEAGEGEEKGGGKVRDFFESSQRTVEEWQKRVDERIRMAVESISPFAALQKELGLLMTRIEELERRISELSKD
ncbi:MAG: polyhydroxyalkanoate synthesis regulator DNA-binding domain-containing protein [Deltaproteobacteria bacterium]|nr:polyhydroxyalkanoate synthesis regulator DNA-binding domain-containing protein [Deltaproteobacteria bacterium]